MKKVLIMLFIAAISIFISCGSDDNKKDSEVTSNIKITIDGTETTFASGLTDTYAGADGGAAGWFQLPPVKAFFQRSAIVAAASGSTYAGIFSDNTVEGAEITFNGSGIDTYDEADPAWSSVRFVKEGVLWYSTATTITVTEYGEVGGRIIGTFTAEVTDGTTTQTVTGSFDVERYEDSEFPLS